MHALPDSVEDFLRAIITLSWKGALLALITGSLLLALRRKMSPAWRHGLWMLVFLRLMLPDLGVSRWSVSGWMPKARLTSAVAAPALLPTNPIEPAASNLAAESPAQTDAVPVTRSLETVNATPVQPMAAPWTLAQKLFVVWLLGALSVFGLMVALHLRMTVRLRRDRQVPNEEALSVLQQCCAATRVSPVPALIMTNAVTAPALFGVLRPAILMPSDLVADAASLRLILLHELAHLKRRDLWVQVVTSFVVALHWFNPLAWWAHRRLRAEAEMAADAHVLRLTEKAEAHRFGEVLLGFASRAAAGWALWFAAATVLGIAEGRHDLRRRIDAIVDYSRGRRAWWIVGLTAFVMLAVTGLTQAPAEEVKPALPPGATVSGIVVDEAGKPIYEATAFLSIGDTRDREVRKVVTDEDGRYHFVSVPVKTELQAWARHYKFMDTKMPYLKFTAEDKAEHRIVLKPVTRWVSGTITRKADGSPVKGATIYANQTLDRLPAFTFMGRGQREATTDDKGHYRIPSWSAEMLETTLMIDAPGLALTSARFSWKDGGVKLDLAIADDSPISGRIVDAEGKPVEGVTLSLVQDSFHTNLASKRSKTRNGDFSLVGLGYWIGNPESDAQGRFSGRMVDPIAKNDSTRLVAHHPIGGIAHVAAAKQHSGGDLVLEKWSVLEGQVFNSEGKPLEGAKISLLQSTVDPAKNVDREFSIMHMIDVFTDKGGNYRIDRVLPQQEALYLRVNKEFVPLYDLVLRPGETKRNDLRLPTPRVFTPKDKLRGVTGRVRAPEGHSLKSENFTVEVRLNHEGSGLSESATVDADGRFTTKPVEPGNWQVRVWLKPKDPKLTYAENAGVAMRVLLEQTERKVEGQGANEARTPLELAPQQPLDVGELTIPAEDFEFRQASEAAKRKVLSPMKVKMNAPVRDVAAFATWTGGDGRTLAPEQSFTSDGRIEGTITTASDHQFIVRALKPNGSRWFSGALSAPEDEATEFSSELTLNASVDVEGKVHGLADNYEGDGWIVAAVTVPNAEKIGTVIQGSARTTGWYAWAPVPKDGQFRFKGLPRGRLAISGYGKSWCTVSLDGYGTQSQVNLMKAGPVTKLNFDIRPTRQ